MSSQGSDRAEKTWTVLTMLEWITGYLEKQGVERARYESEVLLSYALGMQRIMLYANFEQPLKRAELDAIRPMVKRRGKHEPMAYISGSRGFWTIDLKTDARALIPRPETEVLVERALELLKPMAAARVLDVGTGSGAIALAIAHDAPQAELAATDLSAEALTLARENATALGLTERVAFFQGDLLAGLPGAWLREVDLLVSNPPYVSREEEGLVERGVKAFEPEMALFAEDQGLGLIKRLVPEAFSALKPGGWLLCEIGYAQGSATCALLEAHGFEQIELLKDLARKDRVVLGQRPR